MLLWIKKKQDCHNFTIHLLLLPINGMNSIYKYLQLYVCEEEIIALKVNTMASKVSTLKIIHNVWSGLRLVARKEHTDKCYYFMKLLEGQALAVLLEPMKMTKMTSASRWEVTNATLIGRISLLYTSPKWNSIHLCATTRVSPISYSCTRRKTLYCLCTATSETQFCYYEYNFFTPARF